MLEDVARSADTRGIRIQRVGVKGLHLPLRIKRKENGYQEVIGNTDVAVELPHRYRGTHMSRMIEVLFRWRDQPLDGSDLRRILDEIRERLDAESAHINVRFKYFLEKRAPVSQSPSVLDYDCEFTGSLSAYGFRFVLGVEVPVTALCPCSKQVSAHGAHSQRAVIRVRVRYDRPARAWIEDLVGGLEKLGSSEIYPMLKREDEKDVTETAYHNPKFVEDILRDVILFLRKDGNVSWYEVECETYESIHNHSAYAYQQESADDWRSSEQRDPVSD